MKRPTSILALLLVTSITILPIAITMVAAITNHDSTISPPIKKPNFNESQINEGTEIGQSRNLSRTRQTSIKQERMRKAQTSASSKRKVQTDYEDRSIAPPRIEDILLAAKRQAIMLMPNNPNTPPSFLTKSRDITVDIVRNQINTKIATLHAVDHDGDPLRYYLDRSDLHDASPYFSVDPDKGDLILRKQFTYYPTELSKHQSDDDDDEDSYQQTSVNRNLYFLTAAASDGIYPTKVDFQVHVIDSSISGPHQLEKWRKGRGKNKNPVNESIYEEQDEVTTVPNRKSIVPSSLSDTFDSSGIGSPEIVSTTTFAPTSEASIKQLIGSELLPETQSSSFSRPLLPNDKQQPENVTPPPIVISLVVVCSCLSIVLVLLIFIVPLSVKRLKRRLKHVERQHETLSKRNSNGSSFVCSSSGSIVTPSHMPSLSQFTLGSDRSCGLGGSSVLRQSPNSSTVTVQSPLTNPTGPLNRVNNGSIVNPVYLQQQQHLLPYLHLAPEDHIRNEINRQNAHLIDDTVQLGNLNRSRELNINNYPDYHHLDDEFYSTINTENTVLDNLNPVKSFDHLSVLENLRNDGPMNKPLIYDCQPPFNDNTIQQGIESPVSDSGSSIRSLVRFLSLPDRRHQQAQRQPQQNEEKPSDTNGFESTVDPTFTSKQQAKTIARASNIAREQVNNDSHQWELDRHRLKFLEILDEGQFGLVWRCKLKINAHEEQTVAVKTLKKDALQDERGKEELLAEIKIMKMVCQHPNVVKIMHSCTSDVSLVDQAPIACNKPILLVMEYVELGKLQSFLEKSRVNHRYATNLYTNIHATSDHLTSRDLIKFIYHVAKGMEYISFRCIVHRDLASRNILVNSERICKIGDFGMARHMQSMGDVYERHSRNTKVPVRWMAPEVLIDNKFTTKSDVFSFGILMWEIVTLGSTPYRHLETDKIPKEVAYRGQRPEKPSYCHPLLYKIMSKCWSHKPEDRPTFSGLVKQLDEFLLSSYDYIELDQYPDNNYCNISETEAPNELL